MAIIKRKRKFGIKYQVKVRDSEGKWISETFDRMEDAKRRESEIQLAKLNGHIVSNQNRQLTMDQYFQVWNQETRDCGVSIGWRRSQVQMYEDYIRSTLGSHKLHKITPALIARTLRNPVAMGRSKTMQLHIYSLLHKLFTDAIELFQVLDKNPVLKSLRPKLPQKEAAYLESDEMIKLLDTARGTRYEVPIWLGLYVGLRIGEIQALKWENVDLEKGLIHIRANYVRKEKRIADYPKGKKWHTIKMPPELWDLLKKTRDTEQSEFVCPNIVGGMLSYHTYHKALRGLYNRAGIKKGSTHTLRHSSSELYLSSGASIEDLKILYGHSSSSVTQRYVHDKGERLGKVADVVRLFPASNADCSPNVPHNLKVVGNET